MSDEYAPVTASRPRLYDRLGATYTATRRPDPRIDAAIRAAIGDARTVVNVGAGSGSYEPPQTVLAVEPSRVMIGQRPPGAAPAAVSTATHLPLRDGAVDAALCVLTVHHWGDRAAGLAELRRVARRAVVFTWDPDVSREFWLVRDYFPEIATMEAPRAAPIAWLCARLGTRDVRPVPVPRDCRDGFLGAYWARPEAYLDPAVQAGASGLALLDPTVRERGMAALARDLERGAWHDRHAHLLARDALDIGYRLVVADWTARA